MKYVVMLTRAAWEDEAPEEVRRSHYGEIMEWWGRQAAAGKLVGGHQLEPPHTATTVVLGDDGSSRLIDGPYLEAKESIGGYGVLEAADLDEAIRIFRSFPSPGTKAEIRPILER